MEAFDVATTAILDNLTKCECYAKIYNGPSESIENTPELKKRLESALPELYASLIVFSVKAETYFEAKCTYPPLLNYLY